MLTYHSGNLAGNDYATNNLVALAEDLAQLRALSVPVVPLDAIVNARLSGAVGRLPERVAAITLDDGLDFDFEDLVHPFHGPQSSVRTVLERHERAHGLRMHATAFVIASPQARRQIAEREMLNHQWIGDHWWAAAVAGGRFGIGNHSWDHVSPSVTPVGQREGKTGSFRHIDSFEDADLQVRTAREFIGAQAPNPAAGYFAYPYGDRERLCGRPIPAGAWRAQRDGRRLHRAPGPAARRERSLAAAALHLRHGLAFDRRARRRSSAIRPCLPKLSRPGRRTACCT